MRRANSFSLVTANSWSAQARTFLSPETGVRSLNALVRRAALLSIEQTFKRKPGQLFGALREPPLPTSFSLDVLWTDDEQIQTLNRDYRGKDKATDVLSFPFWEDDALFEGEPVPLGDLVLSLQTAIRQAEELKHSLQEELAFLAIHGTLHLLGFDHDTPSKRRAMFAWQDELSALLKAT